MQSTDEVYAEFTHLLATKGFLDEIALEFRIDRSDLVNEIYVLLPRQSSRFAEAANPDAYLATTARNVARTIKRKERRFESLHSLHREIDTCRASDSSCWQSEIETQEAVEVCQAAVARLPEPYRDAARACFLDGVSPRKYAEHRNVAFECVRVRLRRAKAMLKRDAVLVHSFC